MSKRIYSQKERLLCRLFGTDEASALGEILGILSHFSEMLFVFPGCGLLPVNSGQVRSLHQWSNMLEISIQEEQLDIWLEQSQKTEGRQTCKEAPGSQAAVARSAVKHP